jgi:hypothetical protein
MNLTQQQLGVQAKKCVRVRCTIIAIIAIIIISHYYRFLLFFTFLPDFLPAPK